MPIFEYKCQDCSKEFEELVFGSQSVKCPGCGSENTKKKISAFRMSGADNSAPGEGGGGGGGGCGPCSGSSCSSCG